MHYGYRTGFGSGSNIKCNKKVKNQKGEANFLENNAASDIEKARFCTIFCCWKTVLGQSILRGFLWIFSYILWNLGRPSPSSWQAFLMCAPVFSPLQRMEIWRFVCLAARRFRLGRKYLESRTGNCNRKLSVFPSDGAAFFPFLNFKMISVIYLVWLQGCTATGEKWGGNQGNDWWVIRHVRVYPPPRPLPQRIQSPLFFSFPQTL